MKHIILLLGVYCLGLPGLAVSAADEGGLIANPGFETVEAASGFAAAWTPTYWSNAHGKVILSDQARTGRRSVEISGVPPEKITDAGRRNNTLVV